LQEIPPSDPVDQGDEGDWETVGEPVERSRSPAPVVEELVSQRSTTEVKPHAPVAESRTEPVAAPAAEEPATTEAEEEAPAEAGLVDIASILGAPTVTVVRSSL
jgi:septal ring-binding cell division protein DamX